MIYKIRVIIDTKEDIFRDIDIKGKQNLWNLHLGIKSAFNLSGDDLSTFNLLENDGTIIKSVPLEDMSDDGDGEIMSDIYIDEAFNEIGTKAQFQYGLLDLWEFFCELIEINPETKGVNYPITVFRFGTAPLKAPKKNSTKESRKNKKNNAAFLDDEFAFDDEFAEVSDFDDEDDFDDDFDDNDDDFEEDFDDEEI